MGHSPFRICLMTLLVTATLTGLPRPSAAEPACTCRYAGQSFQVNSCVCITTSAVGPQMACCGMVINNPSWRFTKTACPTAELQLDSSQNIEMAQSPQSLAAAITTGK